MNIKFCELNRQWQPQKLLFESTYINETMIECFESLNKWIYFFWKELDLHDSFFFCSFQNNKFKTLFPEFLFILN